MVMDFPYESVRFYHLRLDPNQSASKSIGTVEGIFKKNFRRLPFEYNFVDEAYAAKFSSEECGGKLAGVFTGLAILITSQLFGG